MIGFQNDEQRLRFKNAVAYAKSLGGKSWESLRDSLRFLSLYSHGGAQPRTIKAVLYHDFIAHSFEFGLFRVNETAERLVDREKFWFNGGLICHGAGSNGMAELSVTLSPKSHVNWQIHT